MERTQKVKAKKPDMFKVVVVGCGQLGARHVQGLLRSKCNLSLNLCDTSKTAQKSCFNLIKNCAGDVEARALTFWDSLDDVCSALVSVDFVIVATTAMKREEHLAKLFRGLDSKFWLIEKPLSQSLEGLSIMKVSAPTYGVWVNHPRRLFGWHKKIRHQLGVARKPLKVQVVDPNLGLACNATHFIDLVNWWTREHPIFVDTSKLADDWVCSSRSGFFEVEGTLHINFSKGTTLEISSGGHLKKSGINIFDHNESLFCRIDERVGEAKFVDGKSLKGRNKLQSEITGIVFDELVQTGCCELISLHEAIDCSSLLVEKLNLHWKQSRQRDLAINAKYT